MSDFGRGLLMLPYQATPLLGAYGVHPRMCCCDVFGQETGPTAIDIKTWRL